MCEIDVETHMMIGNTEYPQIVLRVLLDKPYSDLSEPSRKQCVNQQKNKEWNGEWHRFIEGGFAPKIFVRPIWLVNHGRKKRCH